jgi:hypothetical protein
VTEARHYHAATWQQELLLRAALAEGPEGVAAWKQWKAAVDPEQLDYDSYCLLPLLYDALRKRGVSDPETGRLKGVYRRTWYDNTLRFHAAAEVLRALHATGIQTLLLKGAALSQSYYRDPGLRPMDDFDILVPTRQGAAALDLLKACGWTPLFDLVGFSEAEALASGHAYPFRNARDQQIDLHWHVFYQRVHPDADGAFWQGARPITVSGVQTLRLNPADQLLHVCVHGTERAWWGGERMPNLRWVADAAMILRNARQELDWDRLFAQTQRFEYVLPMREALGYLHDIFASELPAAALSRIRAARVPVAERIAERARTRPSHLWGPWVALGVSYLEYRSTLPPGPGLLERLAGLTSFLGRRWGTDRTWKLPFMAVFRGLRRILWALEGHWRRQAESAPGTRR